MIVWNRDKRRERGERKSKMSTPVGFEPTPSERIALAGQRFNQLSQSVKIGKTLRKATAPRTECMLCHTNPNLPCDDWCSRSLSLSLFVSSLLFHFLHALFTVDSSERKCLSSCLQSCNWLNCFFFSEQSNSVPSLRVPFLPPLHAWRPILSCPILAFSIVHVLLASDPSFLPVPIGSPSAKLSLIEQLWYAVLLYHDVCKSVLCWVYRSKSVLCWTNVIETVFSSQSI